VISYDFWKRRFGKNPGVIGTAIEIKAQSYTIVGVTPPDFFGDAVGRAPDIWIPLMMQPGFDRGVSLLVDPTVGWLRIMGRLNPDATEQHAASALALVLSRLQSESTDLGSASRHLGSIAVSDGRRGLAVERERLALPLRLLAGLAAIVLLIACANVANLLVARASTRQREVDIRLAVGASRLRLIRQFLTEGVLLAAIGGALGLVIAWWGSRVLLVLLSPDGTPLSIDVTPNSRILVFATVLSLVNVLVFALAPALQASRTTRSLLIREVQGTGRRMSAALVVSQVALSLLLLVGAALFVQTFRNLRTRDLGFESSTLLQFRVQAAASGYSAAQRPILSRRLLSTLTALPSVQAAGAASSGFATGSSRTCCIVVEGHEHYQGEEREIQTIGVGPGYFRVLQLPLVRGRDFLPEEGSSEVSASARVAIVNEEFVRRYVENRDPIGQRFGWGEPPDVSYDIEIVGVARNAFYDDLRAPIKPLIYFPAPDGTLFVVRTTGAPSTAAITLQKALRNFDRNLEFSGINTIPSLVERTLIRDKFLAALSTVFGALAAALAAVGLYGITAYTVTARTREIGIRMALGAPASRVLLRELGYALRLALFGVAIGIPATLAAGRLIRYQVFGIGVGDPRTLAFTSGLLLLIAAAAAFWPARRASRIDPQITLRSD
jgi:predicted permease